MTGLGLNAIQDKDLFAFLTVSGEPLRVLQTGQLTIIFSPVQCPCGKTTGGLSQWHMTIGKHFDLKLIA